MVEEGGFVYDADSYADDLPYWDTQHGKPQLIVPYTLDNNDMRFATNQGFNSGDQFFAYLRDAFDVLYAEGKARQNDVHRIALSLGRAAWTGGGVGPVPGLHSAHERVWVCRRIDLAQHWIARFPFGEASKI